MKMMQWKLKLHQLKFGIQFKNIQMRLFVHQKRSRTEPKPNHTMQILSIWNDQMSTTLDYDINCQCSCHRIDNFLEVQFHSSDCLHSCLTSNESYIQYLMTLVHPVYV